MSCYVKNKNDIILDHSREDLLKYDLSIINQNIIKLQKRKMEIEFELNKIKEIKL